MSQNAFKFLDALLFHSGTFAASQVTWAVSQMCKMLPIQAAFGGREASNHVSIEYFQKTLPAEEPPTRQVLKAA